MELGSGRFRRIFKAVWSGTAVRVLTSGMTLISLPLAVRYLGAERYGVWATIATTAVWINLLDLGVANTLTNQIARAYALDDKQGAARSFTNALLVALGVSSVGGVIFTLLFPHINWPGIFHVGPAVSATELGRTVAVAVGVMLFGLPCNLGSKLLAGYQELDRSNYAACAGAVASVVGLALGIALHVGMPALYLMSVGCLTFSSLAALLLVIRRKPWLRPRMCFIEGGRLRELTDSGSSFFLIQLAGVVVFSSDNLIVSHYLGAAEVTPYSVTWRLAAAAGLLQSLLFPALWPAYTEAYAKREYAWIRQTFRLTIRSVVALNLVCAVVLVAGGRSMIRIWAGAAAVPGRNLLVAMAVWTVVSAFMSVESCLLAALNRTREQAALSVLAAAVNVASSVVLVRYIGAVGVITGTVLSYMLVLIIPQSLIVRGVWRELGEGAGPVETKKSDLLSYEERIAVPLFADRR